MTLWCSINLAQLYKLRLSNKIIIQPFLVEYQLYCTLGSEYLPRLSASGNSPTLGAIFGERARHIRGAQIRAGAVYIYIHAPLPLLRRD